MGDSRSYEEILKDPQGVPTEEVERIRTDYLLGVTAVLLTQRGHADAANLLADVTSTERNYTDKDWDVEYYEVVLDVEPHLVERFTDEIHARILETLQEAVEREAFGVTTLRVRSLLPKVDASWRDQVRNGGAERVINQARRVRLDPQHPIEDSLHFTNVWEHRLYQVLKAQQAELDDTETIGIIPLAGVRVRERVFEPDFLITYRGWVGIIEVDGPYHQGQKSSDTSRDRQFLHAGVKYVDRLDVRDVKEIAQVEKFVADFLKRLGS
ncbi:hypothetical protein ACFWUW_03615 [Streptomyces sp. NPDC058655]|uniref:hypothetical protein n=1 Tax=Streptomyces sp. NPDC058655 TaxID=3346577 RepID=UPI003662D17A